MEEELKSKYAAMPTARGKDVLPMLAEKGMAAYLNGSVPCGDGGLALGQAYYLGRPER